MGARPPQQPILPAVGSAQCQDQNWCRPLPAVPRLILQCDNGIHVPLTIMPGSYSPGVVGSEKIFVPDSSYGFGVVSFPKSCYASPFRRTSSTSMADRQLWLCETRPGASEGGQLQGTRASLRGCDSDTYHAMAPVVNEDGKIVSHVETHPQWN